MTTSSYLLLVLALAVAAIDWAGVAAGRVNIEYVAKPLVMVTLIGVALSMNTDFDAGRGFIVAALGASLIGDVVLMVPEGRFEGGLGAFFVAHILYVFAFAPEMKTGLAIAATVAMGTGALMILPRLIWSVKKQNAGLAIAVFVYVVAVGATAVSAIATGFVLAGIGGVLFVASDSLLGWNRFVKPTPGGRALIHATYHLGQMGLVTWLAS